MRDELEGTDLSLPTQGCMLETHTSSHYSTHPNDRAFIETLNVLELSEVVKSVTVQL